MKTNFGARIAGAGLLVGLLTLGAAVRGFEVPRHVFLFDQLAEAQAAGFEDEEPLLLLYADPKKKPT